MKPLPAVHSMPRVEKDLQRCADFVAQYPAGKPFDRLRDIDDGLARIQRQPKANRIGAIARSGLPLRRLFVAQFVIIYAYQEPNAMFPNGIVSIRAIRHQRMRDPFRGVKEPPPPPYGAA